MNLRSQPDGVRALVPKVAVGAVAATALASFAVGIGGIRDLSGRVDAGAARRADHVMQVQRLRSLLNEQPLRERPHRSQRR